MSETWEVGNSDEELRAGLSHLSPTEMVELLAYLLREPGAYSEARSAVQRALATRESMYHEGTPIEDREEIQDAYNTIEALDGLDSSRPIQHSSVFESRMQAPHFAQAIKHFA